MQAIEAYQSLSSKSVVVIGPSFILVSIVCIISASCLQIIAWWLLMRHMGVKISWQEVLKGYTLNFLPRYVPGSIWGYISRAEWLKQSHNIPYATSNRGSILDVILIIQGICLVSIIFIIQTSDTKNKILVISLFCLILGIVWQIIKQANSRNVFSKYFLKRLTPIEINIQFIHWLILCTLHGIVWFLYGASINWIIKSVSPNTPLFITKTTYLFSLSWLLGFIVPFVPSGVGIREHTLSSLVSLNYLLSFNQSINIAVISRLLISLVEINWLIIGYLIRFLHRQTNTS